jgi:hypothetical protein
LRLPADSASQAIGDLLHAIAEQEGPWRGFALHVRLGDLHLPDVGYVAVPIRLTVEKSASDPLAFDVAFSAANLPAAFPGFKGMMGVKPGDIGECTLYLAGDYNLPMPLLGKLLDAALTPHVAAISLENFLDEIAAACQARVDRREAEFARYHYYSRTMR